MCASVSFRGDCRLGQGSRGCPRSSATLFAIITSSDVRLVKRTRIMGSSKSHPRLRRKLLLGVRERSEPRVCPTQIIILCSIMRQAQVCQRGERGENRFRLDGWLPRCGFLPGRMGDSEERSDVRESASTGLGSRVRKQGRTLDTANWIIPGSWARPCSPHRKLKKQRVLRPPRWSRLRATAGLRRIGGPETAAQWRHANR